MQCIILYYPYTLYCQCAEQSTTIIHVHARMISYHTCMQLAWSHDSKRFLILGNGKQSSVVVYNICTENSSVKLQQAWILHATDSPTYSALTDEGEHRNEAHIKDSTAQPRKPEPLSANQTGDKARAGCRDSGLNYPYEEAFSMAEFNPTGHVFAVKEVPYNTTLVHLVSSDGSVIKTVDLMVMVGGEERSRRPMNTVFISAYCGGVYAIGLEGGRVALMDAELLQLNQVFKVVGICAYVCVLGYVVAVSYTLDNSFNGHEFSLHVL